MSQQCHDACGVLNSLANASKRQERLEIIETTLSPHMPTHKGIPDIDSPTCTQERARIQLGTGEVESGFHNTRTPENHIFRAMADSLFKRVRVVCVAACKP